MCRRSKSSPACRRVQSGGGNDAASGAGRIVIEMELQERVRASRMTWLVTGAAGFIGSNLVEALLRLDQHVIGLDNFSSGSQRNLDEIRDGIDSERWSRFRSVHGDIRDLEACRELCADADIVLHHAALCSVPQSIEDPLATHACNVTGFLNMLVAARDCRVRRVVYATSCAVYGDGPDHPKVEDRGVYPQSPYATSKYADELYADLFGRCYGSECIGLRYFNVFGRRQDPDGAYAAVVPQWVASMIRNDPVFINGDGETSRDFCYIDNVVQANLLAGITNDRDATNQVFNIGVGQSVTLNELYRLIRTHVGPGPASAHDFQPKYREFRPGDIRHSLADISKARTLLGYRPSHLLAQGLTEAMPWYLGNVDRSADVT
jgi:UDP-N-acetylglucosamine 4-epimerase